MQKLIEFIREWMDIRRDNKVYCKSCDLLREQLSREIAEKNRLLEKFVYVEVKPPAQIEQVMQQPIGRSTIPWKIQRELLEAEDRAKAATIRRQREEAERANAKMELNVEELEKELAIGSEG